MTGQVTITTEEWQNYVAMSDRIKELENENFLLKEQLLSYLALPEWQLNSTQFVMFNTLKVDRIATRETIILAIERERGFTMGLDTMDRYWGYIRKMLRDHKAPYKIITHRGAGWSLELLS